LLLGTGERLSLEAFRTDGALKFEQADFLALSACETALSAKDASGVEIESMAEIAQGAGARAVLASLWRVADSSTAELMIGFYKGRSNGAVTKGEALRQAQLALIARGAAGEGPALAGVPAGEVVKFNHPFYWAPFILLGDSM
jgi:CHAT domain-containing protein